MRLPKDFSVQFIHFGTGLPAIRLIPGDASEPIINVDAAQEVEIDEFDVIPKPVMGYNCIGYSKRLSNRQYDAVAKVLLKT